MDQSKTPCYRENWQTPHLPSEAFLGIFRRNSGDFSALIMIKNWISLI